MKKRILSLLLVLMLVITVSVLAVEANTPFEEPEEGGVVTAYCDKCETNVDWYPLTVTDGALDFGVNNHGYVPEAGLAASAACTVSGNLCLYLNGEVTHTGSAPLFNFTTDATEDTEIMLSVMGDETDGKIVSSASESVFKLAKNATDGQTGVNMYSGTVDAKASTATRGPVFYLYERASVKNGVLNMHGGTFYGSTTNKTQYGGTVYTQGTVNVYGGLISGGHVSHESSFYGGNIHMRDESTFYMSGGTISGGHMTSKSNVTAYGGNINVNKGSTFTMVGGTISGGHAEVSAESGADQCGYGGNIRFAENCTVSISGDAVISGGEAVGVVYARGGNIYFTSGTLDIDGGTISGGSTYNGRSKAYNVSSCRGGSIYMAGGTVNITAGQLTHNTKQALTYAGGIIYMAKGTLTVSGGTISGGYAYRGGNIAVISGTLNIDGGTISGGSATATGGNIHNEAALTISGGSISGGDAETYGGSIYTSGTFSMTNGTITGGSAQYGGALIIRQSGVGSGKFVSATISGGNINGGTATEEGDSVMVTKNHKLTVADGFTGTLDVCFEGAAAEVLVDGKIDSNMAAASDYVAGGMVFAEVEDVKYPVVGKGNELVLAEAVITNGDGQILKIPANAQAAVDTSLNNGEYVELQLAGTSFAPTVATRVDFNGKDATVTGGADKLTGMDSATNDYNEDGAAKVTFETGTPALNNVVDLVKGTTAGQRKYLALANDEGSYSYHRYYLTIDGAGLRYNKDIDKAPGLLYSAAFKGDAAVAEAINKGVGYGIEFKYGDTVLHTENFLAPSQGAAVEFEAGVLQTGKKVAFSGFMTEDSAGTIPGTETYFANIKILGRAYIEVVEGQKIYCSVGDENSLQDVVKVYYNSTNAHIVDMKEKYGYVFDKVLGWDFAA